MSLVQIHPSWVVRVPVAYVLAVIILFGTGHTTVAWVMTGLALGVFVIYVAAAACYLWLIVVFIDAIIRAMQRPPKYR